MDEMADVDVASEERVVLSSEDVADMAARATAQKQAGNEMFGRRRYVDAITAWEHALAVCPGQHKYDLAVLKANLAAAHLHLEEWSSANDAATGCLDILDQILAGGDTNRQEAVVELPDTDAAFEQLQAQDQRRDEISKLRVKALLRRAKARSALGGWANLQGAEEDFKTLNGTADRLAPADLRGVRSQLQTLPARVKQAQEQEMGEMMGKLKELGNGLLKPFGLSTDMFKMTKDEKTGGYSMSVNS